MEASYIKCTSFKNVDLDRPTAIYIPRITLDIHLRSSVRSPLYNLKIKVNE